MISLQHLSGAVTQLRCEQQEIILQEATCCTTFRTEASTCTLLRYGTRETLSGGGKHAGMRYMASTLHGRNRNALAPGFLVMESVWQCIANSNENTEPSVMRKGNTQQ